MLCYTRSAEARFCLLTSEICFFSCSFSVRSFWCLSSSSLPITESVRDRTSCGCRLGCRKISTSWWNSSRKRELQNRCTLKHLYNIKNPLTVFLVRSWRRRITDALGLMFIFTEDATDVMQFLNVKRNHTVLICIPSKRDTFYPLLSNMACGLD